MKPVIDVSAAEWAMVEDFRRLSPKARKHIADLIHDLAAERSHARGVEDNPDLTLVRRFGDYVVRRRTTRAPGEYRFIITQGAEVVDEARTKAEAIRRARTKAAANLELALHSRNAWREPEAKST